MESANDLEEVNATADIVQRDLDRTFSVLPVSADNVPTCQTRLRLKSHLAQAEQDAAHASARSVSLDFADKLADAEDWETPEGYLSALTPVLYSAPLPFAQRQRPPPRRHHRSQDPARQRSAPDTPQRAPEWCSRPH